jgi:2-dehydro-3-deoxygluconokinase
MPQTFTRIARSKSAGHYSGRRPILQPAFGAARGLPPARASGIAAALETGPIDERKTAMPLKILPAEKAAYDVVTLGECMIRLSPPGHGRIEFAPYFEAWVGGAEYNVSYALARYGLRTAWVSKLVDNPLGHFIRNHGRAVGMDMSHAVMVPYDGVGIKDRIGLNFTEVGTGIRASVTMYDRGHAAASHMKAADVDWEALFARGVRWFHTGGIFTALSDDCAATVKTALTAARKAGAITSYDLNFRSKLWTSEKAIAVTRPLMELVDVLVGNEEDFQKVLGFEVEGADEHLTRLEVDKFKAMVTRVAKTYPHLLAVGTTLREVVSGLVNNWSAIMYYDGRFYVSRRWEGLEIEDRVGGGDGFCSGFMYALMAGMAPQEAVNFGAAHGALLQSTRGDTSQVTLAELKRAYGGASARIIR